MNNIYTSYDETIKIASELYKHSGRAEGRDLENWLEAERILKAGEEFCDRFMKMLVKNPLAATKLMEAITLLIELEQNQPLDDVIHSS